MALQKATTLTPVPLRGGMTTVRDPAQLTSGTFSMVRNMRPKHPGFVKRPGQTRLHTTADGTNKVITLHQFRKNEIDEIHFFRQMSDGDIEEATAGPPTVTAGAFGTEVLSGNASPRPAAWGSAADLFFLSTGVDYTKVYAGTANYVKKFVKYDFSSAPPTVPVIGFDYTDEVTDGLDTTAAILDSLDTYAAFECVFICTPVPANRLTWTFGNSKPNGTAAVGTLSYRKSDNTWADTAETDGTILSTATLGQTGSMTWTPPADEIPCYMYGVCGFWYRWETATQLDAEVEVTKVTYGTDGTGSGTRTSFINMVNTWDGLSTELIEALAEKDASGETGKFYTYGTSSIALGEIAFDENDILHVSSYDPLCGLYVDPMETPNIDTTSAAVLSMKYWDGDSWAALTITDGTIGATATSLSSAGWITWTRPTDEQPRQFRGTDYYGYWYQLIWDDAVTTTTVISIEGMPYFDITEQGYGLSNCAWQDRMCYSFTRWGQYVHVSKQDEPTVLNGPNYAVLEAGDGRTNKVLGMHRFYNEMIAWQEEKGIEGGCTTLFEGYSPTTFGKLVLSSQVGIMNAKAHAVVDGVLTSTATDESIKTLVFWLSRYGVCVSDGRTIAICSDPIQNYFDPQESECVRFGYESENFLAYDSTWNCLRIGLVSGSSATVPNIWFVFDLEDKVWYQDDLGQPLSCMTEVESVSGTAYPITQVGGGTADGTVYRLNTGTNDVGASSVAITSYIDIVFHANGQKFIIGDTMVRCKVQAAGNMTFTMYSNVNAVDGAASVTETLSMTAEDTNDVVRTHLQHFNLITRYGTMRIYHATASQQMDLYDLGTELHLWEGV